MPNPLYIALAILFWVLLGSSFRRNRSRYRNCYLLFFALFCSTVALTSMTGPFQEVIAAIIGWAVLLTLLAGWLLLMTPLWLAYFPAT